MREYNAKEIKVEAEDSGAMKRFIPSKRAQVEYGAYIGPDIHKDTIAVALAEPGRAEPLYEGLRNIAQGSGRCGNNPNGVVS